MLIHVIADYGPGDLAFAEVAQRIKLCLPDAEPLYTPVPAFATLAAGFCVAQLGLNPAPPNTLIYHNVAPRKDEEEARANNEGERLAFARLPTGGRGGVALGVGTRRGLPVPLPRPVPGGGGRHRRGFLRRLGRRDRALEDT